MPHIRLVIGDDWEGLYINGTLVEEDDVVRGGEILRILKNNLGYDAEVIEIGDCGCGFPNKLREFPPELIPASDRI